MRKRPEPVSYTHLDVYKRQLQAGLTLVTAKLLIIVLLIAFTSPTATHALAKAALTRGVQPQLDEDGEPPSKP